MAQRIWIVRHGNREDFGNPNWSRTAVRPYDPALSPDGERQAREVGESLRHEPLHRIFASPFLRTIQTASHIADVLDLPVALEPGIGEVLPKVKEMPELLPVEERNRRFPRIDTSYMPCCTLSYPEPEEAGHRRAAETVRALADRYPGQNLLCVTHASPVVGIIRHLTGMKDPISVPLCAVFTLEHRDGNWRLVQQADISHLSDRSTSLRHAHVG